MGLMIGYLFSRRLGIDMDEEPLGDVLERYERSKALYKALDAEFKSVEGAVADLSERVFLLQSDLESRRPKAKWETLLDQDLKEIDPLKEERDLALRLAEEQYIARCEEIEAVYQAKAGPIRERYKLQQDLLGDDDEDELDSESWYKQNSSEYAMLFEKLNILKAECSEIHKKRLETRRELNASRDEKIRRLGK